MIMTKNTLTPICVLFATSLFLFGCKEQTIDNDESNVKLLKTIVIEEDRDITAITFEYDSQGRITKQMEPPLTATFTYNSAGELIKLIWEREHIGIVETLTFAKNGNSILMTSESSGNVYSGTIELDAQGLPVKILGDGNSALEYQNGNVSKITFYSNTSIEYGYYTISYDNKKSPWLHCKTPQWYFMTAFESLGFPFIGLKNNPTAIEGDFAEGWSSDHFVYTYDNDGYPINVAVTETERYGTYHYTISYTYTPK